MERPNRPKLETPAARHYAHTQREWTEHPDRAPGWSVLSADRVIGDQAWTGCLSCEDYADQTWRPALAAYDDQVTAFNQWTVEQQQVREEMETMTVTTGGKDLATMLRQYDERRGS